MALDRAPIEFQTFYFSHVWLVPPTVRMWDESGSGREAQDDLLQSGLVARKEVVVERKSNMAFSSQILRCWAGGQLVR